MHTALVAAFVAFAALAVGAAAGGLAGLVLGGAVVLVGVVGATVWTLGGFGAPAPRGGRL